MQPKQRTVEEQAAITHIEKLLEKFGSVAINHLIQVAEHGGLIGRSPKQNVLATLIQGETGEDYADLSESQAQERNDAWRTQNGMKVVPAGDHDYVERFFLNIEEEHKAEDHPKLEFLVEVVRDGLEGWM